LFLALRRAILAAMGLLKEKSSYRPTRFEQLLAWVVTLASAATVVWFALRARF
jgi:hypothetical protein